VVATTQRKIDNRLAFISLNCGVDVYRGDVTDVLNRYYQCAHKFDLSNIVRITGDCPLIDVDISSNVIATFQDASYDYVRTGLTYPDGLSTEIFSFDILEYISKNAKLHSEREHVTPYLWKHPEMIKMLTVECENDLSGFRFTLDYTDDLLFIRKVYEKLYLKDPFFGLKMILELLRNENDIYQMMPKTRRYEGYYRSLLEDDRNLR